MAYILGADRYQSKMVTTSLNDLIDEEYYPKDGRQQSKRNSFMQIYPLYDDISTNLVHLIFSLPHLQSHFF